MTETDLENALQRWITPLVAPSVAIWDRQKANRPTRPFLTLRLLGPSGPGGAAPDWSQNFDAGRPGGQEIEQNARHNHEYVLRLQSYAAAPAGARSLLLAVHDAASAETQRAILDAQGVTIAEVGVMQDLGALLDTDWEGRSLLEIRIRAADVTSERFGYIGTIGYDPSSGFTN